MNQLHLALKSLIITISAIILVSCATNKTPLPINGSKADGTVTLAYDYNDFEKPVIDWAQAGLEATKRCNAWGYSKAQRFGLGQSTCSEYGRYGCERTQVNVTYQCI